MVGGFQTSTHLVFPPCVFPQQGESEYSTFSLALRQTKGPFRFRRQPAPTGQHLFFVERNVAVVCVHPRLSAESGPCKDSESLTEGNKSDLFSAEYQRQQGRLDGLIRAASKGKDATLRRVAPRGHGQ